MALDLAYRLLAIRFNLNYERESPATKPGPNPVGPGSARPELRFLVVPMVY